MFPGYYWSVKFFHNRADMQHLLVHDNEAAVELQSLATAKHGMRFNNRYCLGSDFYAKAVGVKLLIGRAEDMRLNTCKTNMSCRKHSF